MSHDIKQCLDAGMDEHIGKPLEVEEFYETLLKVLGKKVLRLQKVKSEDKRVFLDKDGAVKRLGGNEALWLKTTCKFYEKYHNLPIALNKMLEKNEAEALQIYIHSLKGLCGTIGANILYDESSLVETKLKKQEEISKIGYTKLFQVFDVTFEQLGKIYQEQNAHTSENPSSIQDDANILETFKDLEVALELSNVSKVKELLQKLQSHTLLEKNTLFLKILELCDDFDFEAALKCVKTLKKGI